jgi:hypothetical protein
MTLSKRLASMEGRLKALEAWKGVVEEAIEEEDQEHPERTLDGDESPGERDQDQTL